jgi:hypothetical protein
MSEVAVTGTDAAPIEEVVATPNPISTEQPNSGAEEKPEATSADKAAAPEKKPSVRDAIDAAAKKTEAKEAAEDKAAKPEPAADKTQQRDPTGKFAAKPADPKADPAKTPEPVKDASKSHTEPPTRFSADAKAAWQTAPEPVKAEVHRAIRELEQGVTQHKADAEAYKPFKEFHELAKQHNVDPQKALREYVGIDKMLGENFPAGIARIFQNKGVDIRTFAADVLNLNQQFREALKVGQSQRQTAQPSPEVAALHAKIAQLEQRLGGVTSTIETQGKAAAEAQIGREIQEFMATNPPLFDELSEQIAAHIANSGLSLKDAYAKAYADFQVLAERAGLKPQPTIADPGKTDPAAQTRGQKSISGAPGAGSYPAAKAASTSIRESILRAAREAA